MTAQSLTNCYYYYTPWIVLIVYVWVQKFQAYRLKNTTAAMFILLPATSCRDWVRFQESCGLDLMPFAAPAQSNFQGTRSKRVHCFNERKFVLRANLHVQLLHEYAVVFNITASRSENLCSTLHSGVDDSDWDACLSGQETGTNSDHHQMCCTLLYHFCHLHITHQRAFRECS
jgi:hypothetical protein